jgi:hypothetical protein
MVVSSGLPMVLASQPFPWSRLRGVVKLSEAKATKMPETGVIIAHAQDADGGVARADQPGRGPRGGC